MGTIAIRVCGPKDAGLLAEIGARTFRETYADQVPRCGAICGRTDADHQGTGIGRRLMEQGVEQNAKAIAYGR